jgi:rhodanese-related sulfurtransferase
MAALLLAPLLPLLSGCGGSGGRGATDGTDSALAGEVRRRYDAMKQRRFAEVPDVGAAELRRELETADATSGGVPEGILLVDVREPREWGVSMLPGAVSRQAFERDRHRHRGRPIVAYCTIGLRSGLYARRLRREGFDVRNLRGGALAWAHAGGTFQASGRPSRDVHVYAAGWNLLPAGYRAITGSAAGRKPAGTPS